VLHYLHATLAEHYISKYSNNSLGVAVFIRSDGSIDIILDIFQDT